MPDIEGLKADPRFQALPPDRQQAMLQHLGSMQPSDGGGGGQISRLGKQAEQGYEQQVAQPVTSAVEHGAEFIGIPAWAARPISQTVVPQNLTGLGLDVASLALPELGAERVMGEAAGPLARFVGSRMGRMGTMGAIGAGTEALTGGSPLSGAAQGIGGEAGAQALHGIAGQFTRRLGLGPMLRQTTEDFGSALTKAMPWLGKIQTTKDFADNFIHGGAYNKALVPLQATKGEIAKAMKGEIFTVPADITLSSGKTTLSFDEADKLLTQMQHQSHLPAGDMRSGGMAPDWNQVAHEFRDIITDKLNKKVPGMGDRYLKARSRLDAAIMLGGHPSLQRGGVFRHPEMFDPEHGAINQPVAIEQLNRYSTRLQRSIGKNNVDDLLSTLRRGAEGERTDIPPKGEGKAHARVGMSPTGHVHATAHPGRTYKAIGKTPKYFEPPHAPAEIMTQNIISALRQGQPEEHSPGPGVQALDRSRAETLAPTPSASSRALKVHKELSKGKQPDIHRDLVRGRLSTDETNKLVQYASATDPSSIVQGMPLEEVLNAAEVANPDERKMLMPMILQRLKAELPTIQNKTMQANLAQRFQRLQVMPQMEADG